MNTISINRKPRSRLIALLGTLTTLLLATPLAAQTKAEEDASWRTGLEEDGVKFDLNYRSEDLAAISGADSKDLIHSGQIALITDFDMEKLVGWQGAKLRASLAYRDGDNINDESGVSALFGPQEIFGRGHYLRLTQFWLDQSLANGKVALRIGRLAPGEDFQATECSFNNLSFCANQAGNFVADYWYNWPISQWGVAAQVNLGGDKYVKAGAYQVNPRNLRGDFLVVLSPKGGTGVLTPFEFGWTPTSASGLIGEYKIGGWYSSADRKDVYYDIDGNPASVTGQPFGERSGAWGAFFSAVRQITRGDGTSPKSGLRAIVKGSIADVQTSRVDRTLVGTLVYTGPFKGRPADDIGLGIAFNHLNDRIARYRAESLALGEDSLLPGGTERTIEAYYSFQFGKHLMVRPDVQWIHSPGGIDQRDDVLIVGSRIVVSL
ncbi:carbohydrate porin [Novosphingobium guangzhouense]|uniref:Uncharacterized protein n=1 Tax=Novosphingobium guangzhouense TaxID=1850347 RepID=A0A2K2G5W0_9SPHN|nr:carbohydrate porin [Novosphingobium guangzhouense]PNU06419.1 hypothetical protein A8V01_02385 [Novosphingobium guangzhouense]